MPGHYLQSLLGERENIILSTRHHWFVLASSIVLETVVMFIIFVATIAVSIALSSQTPMWWLAVVIGFVLLSIPIITGTRDILKLVQSPIHHHKSPGDANLRYLQ